MWSFSNGRWNTQYSKCSVWYSQVWWWCSILYCCFQYTVEPLWKGQECLTKVAKFGSFLCTILYKSCLFSPSWQATSFERPPIWVAFIEGFHCILFQLSVNWSVGLFICPCHPFCKWHMSLYTKSCELIMYRYVTWLDQWNENKMRRIFIWFRVGAHKSLTNLTHWPLGDLNKILSK